MQLNTLDIIILVPLLWAFYAGFRKGLIVELASLAALVLGIYIAVHFSFVTADILSRYIDVSPEKMPFIAFIVTFLVVIFVVRLVGKIVEKIIGMVALGFLNRIGGALFSVIKYAVFISVVLLLLNKFNLGLINEETKKDSRLYAPVEKIAPFLWERLEELKLKSHEKNTPPSDTLNYPIKTANFLISKQFSGV